MADNDGDISRTATEMINEGNLPSVNTLPEAFTDRMKQQLGQDFEAFLGSYDHSGAGTLRLNTLRMDKAAGIELCSKAGIFSDTNIDTVPWDPDGLYYNMESRPGKSILHEAGLYYMQEASAMLPGRLLSPQPGEKILDLCAAPGGKSVQIGMAMKGQGLLVSNEIHPGRAAILSENIERMGISNALVTNEDPARLAARFPFFFDRIVVDAPCSGEGMFRKHPEAALEWSPENVTMCSERQLIILESAHVMLRPGGRLVYSTCTFSEEENENVIREFIRRHPEYHAVTIAEASVTPESPESPESPAASTVTAVTKPVLSASCGITQTDPGCFRIFPHLAPGEGHFAAVLEKAGPAMANDINTTVTADTMDHADTLRIVSIPNEISERDPKSKQKNKRPGKQLSSDAALYKPLYTFMEEILVSSSDTASLLPLRNGDTSRLYTLGQQIYLLPEGCPRPDGIKVQRPGLHLGTLKNDRFEPSLALARILATQDVVSYVNHCALSADTNSTVDLVHSGDGADYNSQARYLQDYFAGNTLPCEDQKGWTLVCFAGLGIGWGKASNNMVKNHYPKGLRKQLET